MQLPGDSVNPLDIPFLQLITYAALTLSSVTVACVSLVFTYRQNRGWDPVAFVTTHGMSMIPSFPTHYGASLEIEFWNRRKYPVVVRGVDATFFVLTFDSGLKGWEYMENVVIHREHELIYSKEQAVDPTGRLTVVFEAPFKRRKLDDLVDRVKINVFYFDPVRNRNKTITFTYPYHMGALDKHHSVPTDPLNAV